MVVRADQLTEAEPGEVETQAEPMVQRPRVTKTSAGLEGRGGAAGSRNQDRAGHLKDQDDTGGSEDKRKAGGRRRPGQSKGWRCSLRSRATRNE